MLEPTISDNAGFKGVDGNDRNGVVTFPYIEPTFQSRSVTFNC